MRFKYACILSKRYQRCSTFFRFLILKWMTSALFVLRTVRLKFGHRFGYILSSSNVLCIYIINWYNNNVFRMKIKRIKMILYISTRISYNIIYQTLNLSIAKEYYLITTNFHYNIFYRTTYYLSLYVKSTCFDSIPSVYSSCKDIFQHWHKYYLD